MCEGSIGHCVWWGGDGGGQFGMVWHAIPLDSSAAAAVDLSGVRVRVCRYAGGPKGVWLCSHGRSW